MVLIRSFNSPTDMSSTPSSSLSTASSMSSPSATSLLDPTAGSGSFLPTLDSNDLGVAFLSILVSISAASSSLTGVTSFNKASNLVRRAFSFLSSWMSLKPIPLINSVKAFESIDSNIDLG